jgi:hypothetical protein
VIKVYSILIYFYKSYPDVIRKSYIHIYPHIIRKAPIAGAVFTSYSYSLVLILLKTVTR